MDDNSRLANYFIVYIGTLLFLSIGAITSLGLDWYEMLVLPAWMPPTLVVAFVWGVLFVLTMFSVHTVWRATPHDILLRTIVALYMANAVLLLIWNYVFFGLHALSGAAVLALVTGASVLMLMQQVRRISKKASYMLVPYLVWMALALYVCYEIWTLNYR